MIATASQPRESAPVLIRKPLLWSASGLRLAGVTAAAALCALALPAMGVDDATASAQSCWNSCGDWDDQHDIHEDRQEIRQDQREIRDDLREIRSDIRSGDYQELQRDLRELREDRADLRDDQRDLRQDQHDAQRDNHRDNNHHR